MGLNPLGGTIPNLKFQEKNCPSPNFQWTLSADAWPSRIGAGHQYSLLVDTISNFAKLRS